MMRGGEVGGYTILETIIFLVITSFLFISFVTVFGGRQQAVEFTQTTKEAQSQIQAIINEVASGFYANNSSLTCSVGAGSTAPPTFISIPSQQGTSNQCVYIGKALHLGIAADREYHAISLAARRLNSTGKEVSSLKEAIPTAIPGAVETAKFQYQLYVTRIVVPDLPGQAFGSVLFLTSLPKYQALTSTLASGAQRVSFGALPSTTLASTLEQAITSVSNITDQGDPSPGSKQQVVMNPQSGIYICFANTPNVANANKKAMIIVGEGASQTSARLETGNYRADICEA